MPPWLPPDTDFSGFANLAGSEFDQHYPQSMAARGIRIPCKWDERFEDGSMYDDRQEQAERVYSNMAFAPRSFLACIVAACFATFSSAN